MIPTVQAMYARKQFPHGWHNDGKFVRLGMPDEAFTGRLVEQFQAHLRSLPESVEQVVKRPGLTEHAKRKILSENALRLCPRLSG